MHIHVDELNGKWYVLYAVVGNGVSSDTQEDTHLILEYELNDICGNYTAPRANRSTLPERIHCLLNYTIINC